MNKPLPLEILQLVNEALENVNSHPEHHLLRKFRRTFYDEIDKMLGSEAHRMKVWLGIIAVQFVLPKWHMQPFTGLTEEEEIEFFHIPHRMIETAKGLINGSVLYDKAFELASHWQEVSDFTGQEDDSPYFHEWCVFQSGLSCVWEAIKPGHCQLLLAEESMADEESSYMGDTAKWACLAYTGGTWTPADPERWIYSKTQDRWITHDPSWYFEDYGKWNRDTDRTRQNRKEFWTWWLSEAIENAWKQIQSND